MRNNIVVFLLFIIPFCSGAQSKKTSYPQSGFEASFPVNPTIENKVLDSKIGEVTLTLFLCEGEDYMIMVSESKYPAEILKIMDSTRSKNMLNGAKNGALNNLAKQMQSKFIETNGEDFLYDSKYEGNKFSGTINEVEVIGQTFLRNNQMYQILVIGNTTSTDIVSFLNSFKLTN